MSLPTTTPDATPGPLLLNAGHVGRLREAGPGHWLTLDGGQPMIRSGQVRTHGEVEICSYVDLADHARRLLPEAGLAAGPITDEVLAAELTAVAGAQVTALEEMETAGGARAWSLFNYRIDPALAARGLHRLRVPRLIPPGERYPLPVWAQDYERGEDGTVIYVEVGFPSQSKYLAVTIATGWPEDDGWRETSAILSDIPDQVPGNRVAAAAVRHLDRRHPGPGWIIEAEDWGPEGSRDPQMSARLYKWVRAVMLATTATLHAQPRAATRPPPEWGLPELNAHVCALPSPPVRRWVIREVISRILAAAQIRTGGGRDPHNPVLLAQLRQTTPDPTLADIIFEAAARVPRGAAWG